MPITLHALDPPLSAPPARQCHWTVSHSFRSFNDRFTTPEPPHVLCHGLNRWFLIGFYDEFIFAAPPLDMLDDPLGNACVKSLLLYRMSSERLRVLLLVVDDRYILINFVISHEPIIHMN